MVQPRESPLIKLSKYIGKSVPSISVDYSVTSLVLMSFEKGLICCNHFKTTEGEYGETMLIPQLGRDFPLVTPHKCLNVRPFPSQHPKSFVNPFTSDYNSRVCCKAMRVVCPYSCFVCVDPKRSTCTFSQNLVFTFLEPIFSGNLKFPHSTTAFTRRHEKKI